MNEIMYTCVCVCVIIFFNVDLISLGFNHNIPKVLCSALLSHYYQSPTQGLPMVSNVSIPYSNFKHLVFNHPLPYFQFIYSNIIVIL